MQDSKRESDPGVSFFLWMGVAVVITVMVLGGLFWGFRVLTSDIKGRGDATIQKNSANNRIQASEKFEDLIAEIVATDKKLDQAAADSSRKPMIRAKQFKNTPP